MTNFKDLAQLRRSHRKFTDEEIDAYRKQRQKMDKDMGDDRDSLKSKRNDLEQLNKSLLDAVKKLNIK